VLWPHMPSDKEGSEVCHPKSDTGSGWPAIGSSSLLLLTPFCRLMDASDRLLLGPRLLLSLGVGGSDL